MNLAGPKLINFVGNYELRRLVVTTDCCSTCASLCVYTALPATIFPNPISPLLGSVRTCVDDGCPIESASSWFRPAT